MTPGISRSRPATRRLARATQSAYRKFSGVRSWRANLVRLVMAQAARRQQVAIDRISFIDAARWLATARDDASLSALVVNPHRPDRYEPRVRKRRPKQYPLMQNTRQALRKSLGNHTDTV